MEAPDKIWINPLIDLPKLNGYIDNSTIEYIKVNKEKDDNYCKIKGVLALSFMEFLDNHRPEGKMCLSNGECANIDSAFDTEDWNMLLRYFYKYTQNKILYHEN